MVSNKEEQLTEDKCCLAKKKKTRSYSPAIWQQTVFPSAYTYIHTQDVSEKGGHILDTWSVEQNKDKSSKMF